MINGKAVYGMLTFAYVLIFSLLTVMIGLIDILFFHKSLYEFYLQGLSLQFGTRKWWVFSGILIGFIYCLKVDVKQFKAKKGVSEGT